MASMYCKRPLWLNSCKLILCVLILALTVACANVRPHETPYTLTLVHLNDTHSHLEAAKVNMTVNGLRTEAELGGFPRLKTVLDDMRDSYPRLLLLHAGDAVQGTLYFTLFDGAIEYDFLNLLGVDAMTFGNHEFDRGPEAIPDWIRRSDFAWVSANIDFSGEPSIDPLVNAFLVKEINGERVAIIGVTTETTPQTTMNVGCAVFNDAVESARRQVELLTAMGINKIILLSHLGYAQDLELASRVAGIDIVVGGHSHSLLGDEEALGVIGLKPVGPYPTPATAPDGRPVLVVQAWQWGHALGKMHVTFCPDGEITHYTGRVVIPAGDSFARNDSPVPHDSQAYREIVAAFAESGSARVYPEDPGVASMLDPYARKVREYRTEKVATAVDDIVRGINSGPGPLACDSMLKAVPKANAAVLNVGGIRRDLARGDITVGDVLEVMPFANTLVLVDLAGAELKAAIEQGIDFQMKRYPGYDPPPVPYVGGMKFSLSTSEPSGKRVSNLQIRDGLVYKPMKDEALYRVVVNAFMAGGGDGFDAIKNASGFRSDTGVIDSDAFRDHLAALEEVANPVEERIAILP